MDAELIAYLDGRFRESADQIQSFREETLRRFEQVDARFEQADARFEQVDDSLEQAAKTARHILVMLEDLCDEVHLAAEGLMGVSERLERHEREGTLTFETIKGWLEPFFNSVEARSRELDARSVQLDVPIKDLDNRVGILESWMARQGKDVMDALAQMLARHRAKSPLPSE